jgi:hypothetical protein
MILLLRATKLGYGMTLGRTGGLSQRRKLRPASSHLQTARGIGVARISGEVESIFKELCRGLNARDFLHVTQERFDTVLSDVWKAHFSSSPTGTLRPANHFFLRTLTRPLLAPYPAGRRSESFTERQDRSIIVSLKSLV